MVGGGGTNLRRGGPYPLKDLDREGPGGLNPRGVQIRWGSKSAVTPASSRRQKISMILQIAPLTDQISVLGGIVVPIADVGCQKKCPAMVKVGLSRFQKLIGELASVYHR